MISELLIKVQIKLAQLLSSFTIIRSAAQIRLPPKTVILSFDDGPNHAHATTERLLSVLHNHNVKAHFSLIGKNVELFPDITRSIASEGHSLANHGYKHLFPVCTKNALKKDIQKCDDSLHSVLGNSFSSHFYRPPNGIYGFSVRKIIREWKLTLLPISFYTMDTECGPARIDDIVKLQVEGITYANRGIIVLHDGKDVYSDLLYNNDPNSMYNRSWIPDAADSIITFLRNKGFKFALLSDF